MRASALAMVLTAACVSATRPTPPRAAPTAPTEALAAAPSRSEAAPAPAVVVAREPEAAPAEFRGAQRQDVDEDGVEDLVVPLPSLPRVGDLPLSEDDPPALVAHGLRDGRYAVDDDVTRAALRALCPARPGALAVAPREGRDPSLELAAQARALLLDALCARAWGAPVAAVLAEVEPLAARHLPPTLAAPLAAAVRDTPMPLTLRPLAVEPLRVERAAPRPALPPPSPSPPDVRCAASERAANAALARAARGGQSPATMHGVGPFCVATDAGRWELRVTARAEGQGDERTVLGHATLAWVPARGAAPGPLAERFELDFSDMTTTHHELAGAFDWDGDGLPEAVVRRTRWEHEGTHATTYAVYTARGGAVTPWRVANAFAPITAVDDLDGDGRPDLVSPSPWVRFDHCGMNGIEHEGPALVARALPDGFSRVDDVAVRLTMAACAPTRDEVDEAADVRDVACARLRGRGAEEVVAALHAALPARPRVIVDGNAEGVCLTFHELASSALRRPPFTAR